MLRSLEKYGVENVKKKNLGRYLASLIKQDMIWQMHLRREKSKQMRKYIKGHFVYTEKYVANGNI